MSKQIGWAKEYIDKYEAWLKQQSTESTAMVGGVEHELYKLAQAIVDDVYGELS